MIVKETWEWFTEEEQNHFIDLIFGSNVPSELERVRKSIFEEKEQSEFWNTLLENITYKWSCVDSYFDVNALVCIKHRGNPEEHDDGEFERLNAPASLSELLGFN